MIGLKQMTKIANCSKSIFLNIICIILLSSNFSIAQLLNPSTEEELINRGEMKVDNNLSNTVLAVC